MSQPTKKQSKDFYEYDSGNGPRPPVPGEESKESKMTTEGAFGSASNTHRSPESESNSFTSRVSKWQENLLSLLVDQDGLNLLFKFVKEEAGGTESKQLDFYFACEGLKQLNDMKDMSKVRKLIKAMR